MRLELAALYAASDEKLGAEPAGLIEALDAKGVSWFGSGFWFSVDRACTVA